MQVIFYKGVRAYILKGHRLIIIHADDEKAFIKNSLKEQITMLLSDNAPFHIALIDKAPTLKSKKQETKDWLSRLNIHFSDELYA